MSFQRQIWALTRMVSSKAIGKYLSDKARGVENENSLKSASNIGIRGPICFNWTSSKSNTNTFVDNLSDSLCPCIHQGFLSLKENMRVSMCTTKDRLCRLKRVLGQWKLGECVDSLADYTGPLGASGLMSKFTRLIAIL